MKFQLCLGWIAVIGSPLFILIAVVGSVLQGDISPSILGKLFWVPFLFLWGLYQLRKCYAIKKSERGLEKDDLS